MSSQAVAWAISHSAGGGGAKAALLSIANYANEYGECWASQATLAQGADCCVRQLRRILADLEALGLIERERRGGAGKGRDTDMIRLRMRELPVIITSKRRDEQPAKIADSSPQQQPDKMSPSAATGQFVRPASGHNGRGATGHLRGGNRTIESDNPNIPSLSNERESAARKLLTEMRPHMSATGNQRSKPIPCEKALTPLIKRHGYGVVLGAAQAFYSTPQARKDGGEFQPGLQVIANDGRLEAMIAEAGEARKRAERIYAEHGYWDPANGDPPDLFTAKRSST